MMINPKLIKLCQVAPGAKVRLKQHNPGWAQTEELEELGKDVIKGRAETILAENIAHLAEAQELLYANDVYSVLVILQAMDAAGKDGTIKHVMSGVNPQGCQVFSFKKPSDEELDHNFLWRYMKALPERGRIGIFNRSYYEEVLVVKVHPELHERQKLPPGKRGKAFWQERYDDINHFERHLSRNGTLILKFFLHLSKDEQKKRFLERLETPEKHWKFSPSDSRRAGLLEGLYGSLRRGPERHQHRMGALVHHPGRSQVGGASGSGGYFDFYDQLPAPHVSGSHARKTPGSRGSQKATRRGITRAGSRTVICSSRRRWLWLVHGCWWNCTEG